MKTTRLFLATTVIALFYAMAAQAALPGMNWRAGQLTLWNNAVLDGDLAYNWSAEMVMIRGTDGHVRTFSANQVREFGWFGNDEQKLRRFVSLAGPAETDRANQSFYEICMTGPLTVVRRLRQGRPFLKRLIGKPAQFSDTRTMSRNPDQFNYYVYDDGQFLAMDRFYSDIYAPRLARYHRELRQYVQRHNLNERTTLGQLMLISHYNYLSEQDAKTASVRIPGHSSE